jgi:AcrR family transcriptional regulator
MNGRYPVFHHNILNKEITSEDWMTDKKNTFGKLKDKERTLRKELILDAAEKVFADKPFSKVNMREIAKEAGISPGSIYTYFPDQETLFMEAALRGNADLVDMFTRLIREENASIEEVANAYVEYIMDHYEYMRMIQHCFFFGKFASEGPMGTFITSEKIIMDLFDELFMKHTKYTEKDIRLLSHFFFASLNGILFNYGRFPSKSRKQLLDHMKKLTKLFGDLLEKKGK